MSILMTLRIAFKALARNKMRTALTMLGMIIGVGAVIAVVALGTGAQAQIEEQVKTAGTNLVTIYAGSAQAAGGVRGGGGTEPSRCCRPMPQALRDLPDVQYVAESVTTRLQLIYGNQNWNTSVEGTNVDLPAIRSWPLKYGSFFTEEDVTAAAKVVVLGSNVSDTLFGEGVDPTDVQIRVRNHIFRVLGVMSTKGLVRRRHEHGRPGLRALHHGDEEADRPDESSRRIYVSAAVGRRRSTSTTAAVTAALRTAARARRRRGRRLHDPDARRHRGAAHRRRPTR